MQKTFYIKTYYTWLNRLHNLQCFMGCSFSNKGLNTKSSKSNFNVVNKRYATCLKVAEKVDGQLYINHSCKLVTALWTSVLHDSVIYHGEGKTCSFCPEAVSVIVFLHTFPWVFQLLSTHGTEAYEMEILKLQPSKRSGHLWVILWRRDQFICWA